MAGRFRKSGRSDICDNKGMYQDGNTLDQNVPEEVYERFIEVRTLWVTGRIYGKLKPWYAALLITSQMRKRILTVQV